MRATLKRVVLENFMCYAHAEFDFYDITKIIAKNGIGKSTIATAYLWCLFNCDYELKDNPVVRREVDGVSVDDMDVSVELTLDVDGKEVTMKKVQKRTYKEAVKDGKIVTTVSDNNSYYVNSVSKTLTAFNEYLGINMKMFKACSNINAFLSRKPDEMREYLFSLIESVTDLDMAGSREELAELVPMLEKYTVEEIRSMNKLISSNVDKQSPVIDGQIKEKERDIQIKSDIDTSDLELLKNSLKEQIKDCIVKQTDYDKLLAEYDKASADILDLKFKQGDLSRKANEDNIKARREAEIRIENLNGVIENCKKDIKTAENVIAFNNGMVTELQAKLEATRVEWSTEKQREFDENSLICPYCRQEYSEDKKEELRADFKTHKEAELNRITGKGNTAKNMLDEVKGLLVEAEQKLTDRKQRLEKHLVDLADLEKQLSEFPQEIDVTATEEYKALEQQIAEKEQAMHKANDISSIKAELKAHETVLRQQLAECESQIAKSDTAADEQRLEELRAEQRTQEQNKANAEKILDLLDELDKAKNETLSDSINSHFSLVRWKLFELNKSGGYKSVCIPTVNGKSILTTMSNKGNRILGRVDICNSIQKISGMSVPIILDDSESLDSTNQKKVAEMVDSQLIMLIVNDSEKLEIVEG
jgi:DNA repair exonuclease SbcCD ATPase subunit|nr:MAG TPA: chromosome partition protein [Bacteriophage sp.]